MRVLILADECNPEWPSLPIVGYKAAKAIAEYADTTVVTQIRNKENIDAVGLGKAKVDYVDTEYIARPVYRLLEFLRGNEGSWTTVMAFNYPNYLAFEIGVWKKYKERIRNGEFDVIHRVTPMSPTQASFIAKRSPVPFVLGPLNGGLKWPKQFLKEMQREREWLSALRGAFKWLPYSRSTFSKSAAILASFEHTIEQVPAHAREKTIDFPEVGIDPELFNSRRARPERDQKSILFAGRLVPYKLPEFVVHAFADSGVLQQHRLIIAGDGPCRVEMEQIVKQHGLEEIVQFVGWKTQAEIGEYMRNCEIFAFPSVRELGAGVVVEAMACGMACAVLDYGAPGSLVDDSCGKRVTVGSRSEVQKDFTAALEALVTSDQLPELGKNAHRRALELFSWDKKALKTLEVYDYVTGRRASMPEFWPNGPSASYN